MTKTETQGMHFSKFCEGIKEFLQQIIHKHLGKFVIYRICERNDRKAASQTGYNYRQDTEELNNDVYPLPGTIVSLVIGS